MKWDRKAVLGVQVLNPRMISIGDNDNSHIDRYISSSQKAETYIECSNEMG